MLLTLLSENILTQLHENRSLDILTIKLILMVTIYSLMVQTLFIKLRDYFHVA